VLKIRTIGDIERIRREGQLPAAVIDELERHFKELTWGLTGEEDAWETYDLATDGPILVLQPGIDDPCDLGVYGMTREVGGLFGTPIEFTDTVKVGDTEFFRIVLVLDNSFCLSIFSEAGRFGPELDEHLREHLAE